MRYNTGMSASGNFDGIIFDIDGTIWDTTEIVAGAWNNAIELSGLRARHVDAAILKREFGKTMALIAKDLWPALDDAERARLMELCCEEEQKAVGKNTADITYPGVKETVKTLSLTRALYIVSNCQKGYTELMMEKTGLAPYITDFECYGRTGQGKAENIRLLMGRRALKKVVYVGDTEGDALECKRAGIPFIWAAYGFGEASPADYIDSVDSFSDLLRIFN